MKRRSPDRSLRIIVAIVVGLALVALPSWGQRSLASSPAAAKVKNPPKYQNPVNPSSPSGTVNTCGDPGIIRSTTGGDSNWYLYCTSDRLNDTDAGVHLIPTFRSSDLIHWNYVNDAQVTLPPYSAPTGLLWSPDPHYMNGKYYLYFTDSDTVDKGAAIGVMTSSTAHGPWTYDPSYVVEPHDAPCCAGSHMWTFDSSIVQDAGQNYIFYGSYFGGVQARKLSADGLTSDPASQTQITIDNQYEGSFVMKHGSYWYEFVSASNCCNGPLTGYSEFVGRSQNVLGPYVDQNGKRMLDAQSGGARVIAPNGNQWIGTGGASVFTDMAGKTWILYHGVDQTNPYLGNSTTTKRQLLMEPLTWSSGWPSANAGNWTSNAKTPGPAAKTGQKDKYKAKWFKNQQPGALIPSLSDDFSLAAPGAQWTWIRDPVPTTNSANGLTTDIQHKDVQLGATDEASLLSEPTPSGNYMVETKVTSDVPTSGCCYNYAQPAIFIYKDDGNYVRLGLTPAFGTRFIEFGKELPPASSGYPNYGDIQIGPPGDTTWLRIAKTGSGNAEHYRAYYSLDDTTWYDGGVWNHGLGAGAKIAIAGIADQDNSQSFHATFGYVHVSQLP